MKGFDQYTYLKGGTGALDLPYERIYGDVPEGKHQISSSSGAHMCVAGWAAMPGLKPYAEARIYEDAKKQSETMFALSKFFSEEQIDVRSSTVLLPQATFCSDLSSQYIYVASQYIYVASRYIYVASRYIYVASVYICCLSTCMFLRLAAAARDYHGSCFVLQ